MRRVISVDSTGTLLKVSRSVGYHYVQALSNFYPISHGDCEVLEKCFNKNFPTEYRHAQNSYPNFGRDTIGCYKWWKQLVREVYLKADITGITTNQFAWVFDHTYKQFATKQCWEQFKDTRKALEKLRSKGFEVIVTSDYDSRLTELLQAHDLFTPGKPDTSLISEVVTSYDWGLTKPDLLHQVKKKHPGLVCHVGDSNKRDVAGARSAGVAAILLTRNQTATSRAGNGEEVVTINSLSDILEALPAS